MSKLAEQAIHERFKIWNAHLLMLAFLLAMPLAPTSLAQTIQKDPLKQLKLQARHAEDSNDLNRAENLYLDALRLAKNSKSNSDTVEILSRLVRVKIDNHKFTQTESLVQDAVRIVAGLKGKPGYDAEMPVWMDDMADAFYEVGERTRNNKVKEASLKRYLDILFVTQDHLDARFSAKLSSLISYLVHNGNYPEALVYTEKSVDYTKRVNSDDHTAMACAYYALGNACLATHRLAKAEFAYNRCKYLMDSSAKNEVWEGIVKGHLGTVKFEGGDVPEARALYKQAIDLHSHALGESAAFTGWDFIALGILEQKSGNLTEASQLFGKALQCFDKCAIPKANNITHPEGGVYSGQVVAAEHLAQLALKRGDHSLAKSMSERAKKIRAQNAYWALCKNPDPDYFYLLNGFLPFPVEIIPTRVSL